MPTYPQTAGYRAGPGGSRVAFDVSAAKQIVGSGFGVIFRVFVNTAGSAAGGVYDMATGGTPSASNLIAAIPTTAGVIELLAPFYAGLYVDPGTGGNVAVSYDP